MSKTKHESHLSVETFEPAYEGHVRTCDGCDKPLASGERYLWGVTSCCGSGCARSLCFACVEAAAKLVKEQR